MGCKKCGDSGSVEIYVNMDEASAVDCDNHLYEVWDTVKREWFNVTKDQFYRCRPSRRRINYKEYHERRGI